MIMLRTANNEEFQIAWAGVATIDGVFRFAVINANIQDVFTAFSNPENCSTLTRVFDNQETEFSGYSVFRGVTVNYDGSVTVALSKI